MLPAALTIPVLTLFLEQDIKNLNQTEDLEWLIHNIYQQPGDSLYLAYISGVFKKATETTSFKKGAADPEFIVENIKGEQVSLASFKGKVVYIDFWYGACGPCHTLFETIRPVKKFFLSKDVVFLTVSIDASEVWKRALAKYNIEGYHVFTQGKEGDHPIIKAYKIGGYPTTCLIDRNGNIYSANPSNKPDELKKQIEDALKIP